MTNRVARNCIIAFALLTVSGLILPLRVGAQDSVYFHYSKILPVNGRLLTDSTASLKGIDNPATLVEQHIKDLILSHYPSASLDSMHVKQSALHVYIDPGEAYSLKIKDYSGITSLSGIDGASLLKRLVDTVNYLANNGYPFAKASFIAQSSNTGDILLEPFIANGQMYRFSGYTFQSLVKPAESYLLVACNMKAGQLYDESQIRNLNSGLLKGGVYRLRTAPLIVFSDSTYTLDLTIEYQKKSSFWAIAGLSPLPNGGPAGLSGEVQANLVGLMNHGDLLRLKWINPGKGSQELSAAMLYPYLFGSRFGIETAFQLKKIDTLFFNRDLRLAGMYSKDGDFSSGIQWSYWNGTRLTGDKGNYQKQLLGLLLRIEKQEPRQNPAKGYFLSSVLETGRIKQSAEGRQDSAFSRSQMQLEFEFFQPMFPKTLLHLAAEGARLDGQSIPEQEQYRLGGMTHLRGFDEQSIMAESYVTGTLGLRYRMDDSGYLGIFWGLSNVWLEGNSDLYHAPGIEFGSGVGNASLLIAYAIGKRASAPFRFQDGRLHIGLAANF